MVRSSELKSEDLGFDPLAGQGEGQFFYLSESPLVPDPPPPLLSCPFWTTQISHGLRGREGRSNPNFPWVEGEGGEKQPKFPMGGRGREGRSNPNFPWGEGGGSNPNFSWVEGEGGEKQPKFPMGTTK